MQKNPYSDIWFHFGTIPSFPDYGLTLPAGSYDLYKDGTDTGHDIQIKPLQTTVLEILPQDFDNDSIPDNQDSCPTIYGTYCHGCPQPTCGTCTYAYCPASGAPYCANSPPSTTCGSLECDYLDNSCTDYHDKTFYCNGQGSCQSSSTCDSYTYKSTSTVCGSIDCDYLDTTCRDYHDRNKYCDGQGSCGTATCDSYTNKGSNTQCGTKDCDYLDEECRDYNDVTKYCNGQGNCGNPSCNSYSNKPSSTQCGTDYYEYSCYWGNDFSDDTAKRLVDYHCDGSGNCNSYPASWTIDEECSSSEYCYGTEITSNDGDFYCKSPECDLDSDCGTNGFIGQEYCQGREIWDYYKRYICNNPGTVNAYCSNSQTAQKVKSCQAACVSSVCISPLIIEDITVEVDGKDHSNLEDGEKVKREAEPESNIDVIVEIKNGYEDEINLEDIEGEVIIEDIDDGDDLEESDDISKIKPGKTEDMKFSFDIPREVKEDSFDILIKIEAEDEKGNSYEAKYELTLDIDKEKHNIEIEKAQLNPEIISCEDSSTLSVSVLNMGSEDEDEARLTVTNSELGIVFENIFELVEAPDDDARYKSSYNIQNTESVGIYPIEIKVYSDLDDLMDDKTVTLTINECEEKECTDSDGKDYWKQGTVKTDKDDYKDYCREDGKLVEYSCEGNEMKKIIALCPYKCLKGACARKVVISTPNIEQTVPTPKKTCFLWWCW